MIWGSKLMIPELSPRQLEVATLIAEGKSAASIGIILGISEHSVNFYKKEVFKKWNVTSISQLCVKLAFSGLIPNPWKGHSE